MEVVKQYLVQFRGSKQAVERAIEAYTTLVEEEFKKTKAFERLNYFDICEYKTFKVKKKPFSPSDLFIKAPYRFEEKFLEYEDDGEY